MKLGDSFAVEIELADHFVGCLGPNSDQSVIAGRKDVQRIRNQVSDSVSVGF